jgi:hypothetical protein
VTREKRRLETGKWKLGSWSFPTYDIRPTTYHVRPTTYHVRPTTHPVMQFVLWQTSPELAKIDLTFR